MHQNPSCGADPPRAASTSRSEVVWSSLMTALRSAGGGLEILDAGGGTGGMAVRLAELGHQVTVVDPNADSLAALERRANEAGVQVRAVQGETGDVGAVVAEAGVHLALLHNVLEYVEAPAAALADVVRTVRAGGAVSLLAANTVAAVLHRAFAGHAEDALHLLHSREGSWGEGDPMPRRFTAEQLTVLAEGAGLHPGPVRGVGVFADLLPGRAAEGEAADGRALLDLEAAAAEHPALSAIATQMHLVGRLAG